MRVLVVLEDPTYDEHVAVPIVRRLFEDLGVVARVEPLRDPHLRGIDEALDEETIRHVMDRYPMIDLFLLVLDRDCDREKVVARGRAREALSPKIVVAFAFEELETWLLALHRSDLAEAWGAVRGHCDPKERWALPLLEKFGGRGAVGGGRKAAMRALSGQWRSLLTLVPELAELKERLGERLH